MSIISKIHSMNAGVDKGDKDTVEGWIQRFPDKGDVVILTSQAIHIDRVPALIEMLQALQAEHAGSNPST